MGAALSNGAASDQEELDLPPLRGGQQEAEPVEHRCTDVPCCLLLLAAALAVLLIRTNSAGADLERLYHGVNHRGQVCGADPGVEEKPFVFWCWNIMPEDGNELVDVRNPVCISACPNTTAAQADDDSEATVSCNEKFAGKIEGVVTEITADYPTSLALRRYCLPQDEGHARAIGAHLGQKATVWTRDAASLAAAWPALLLGYLLAMLLGYLYLYFLKSLARQALLATLFVSFLLLALLALELLFLGDFRLTAQGQRLPSGLGTHRSSTGHFLGVVCFVLSIGLLMVMCCYNRTLITAASCVEMTAQAVYDIPSLLLLPALEALAKGILCLCLIQGFLLLQASTDFAQIQDGEITVALGAEQLAKTWLYGLAGLWLLLWTDAVFRFAVAYVVVEYYNEPYDEDMHKTVSIQDLWSGIAIGAWSHGGSMAVGSLLLSTFKVLQVGLRQSERQQDVQVVHVLLQLLSKVFSRFREQLELVSELAYVDMAMNSLGFVPSARNAREVTDTAPEPLPSLCGAVHAFTFFGNVAITCACTLVTLVLCSSGVYADTTSPFLVENPNVPAVMAFFLAASVSAGFTHVFNMACDSLLYCYALDLVHQEPALNAPPFLHRLVVSGKKGSAVKDKWRW